jgi:hypothetical protein
MGGVLEGEQLLAEIRRVEAATGIVKAFTDVGAIRPVTFTDADRALLLELLQAWSRRVEKLPPGVWDLRNALVEI